MRIRFKKSDLLPVTAIVQSVANPQSTLPILSNVLVTAQHDNVVTFSATDYETRVKIDLPAVVEERGTITLPARTFYDLVKELPEDGDVVLEASGKNVTISSGDIRADLATMPAKDFPEWPELETKSRITLNQKDLKFLLEKIIFAIPNRDPRKVLLGALFEIKPEQIKAIATDGKILAHAVIPVQKSVDDDQEPEAIRNLIIPFKILDELNRTLTDNGTMELSFDDRQVAFRSNRTLFVSNQIEGKYPNYDAVVPKDFQRNITFNKAPMLSAIRRASILSDIKNNSISVNFTGATVLVEAESYERGHIRESFPCETQETDFRMVFNYKFLQDALKALMQDEVQLHANLPTTPAVFRCNDTNDIFYLVMPIKMTEMRDAEEPAAGNTYAE